MNLAVEATRRGRGAAARDLPHTGSLGVLAETGLVETREGLISFVLKLLEEWFAARALLSGVVTVSDLSADPANLSRWRGALRALIEIAPTRFLSDALVTLSAVDPGMVGELVQEGASPLVDRGTVGSLPSGLECAILIRGAMVGFREGLGKLGDLLVPLGVDGEVQALAATTDGSRLDLAWLAERPRQGDVIQVMPGDIRWNGPNMYRWTHFSSSHPGPTPAWPWRTAHDYIRRQMTSLLKDGVPLRDATEVMEEAVYECARTLTGRVPHAEAIEWTDVERALDRLADVLAESTPEDIVFSGWPKGLERPLSMLMPALETARRERITCINAPWPMPDITHPHSGGGSSAWVWEFYTQERLRRRVESVYTGALLSYEGLARGLFHPIAQHLRISRLAPVELRFYLHFPEGEGWASQPRGTWHLLPIELGEASRARVEIVSRAPSYEELTSVEAEARAKRGDLPDSSDSSVHETLLSVYNKRPMTELCYGWLMDDLASIGWCERGRPMLT
jgi:hypothetical protein